LKLWYQSLARETETTPYGAILRRVIERTADPGTQVHVQGIRESAGIGVHYRFLEYHDTREVIYNAMRAEREGFDAFLIGNASDAGIQIAREVTNLPVLGLTEASLLASCMMGGGPLGLITVSDKWTPRIMDNVRRLNMENRIVGAEGLATACPNCKEAVAAQPDELAAMARGYNWSILLMMSMPFTLLGTGAFLMARAVKQGAIPEM
jgi:Asp/Glu/hydantoin racemase